MAVLSRTHVVVLAAGLGTRLGTAGPKALTSLADGRTILDHQMAAVRESVPGAELHVVVGHRAEKVAAVLPGADHVTNPAFATTNTGRSLALGLAACPPDAGVLWLNGDVVFDPEVLRRAVPFLEDGTSFVTVTRAAVGDEEVKYRLGPDGDVSQLSKVVTEPLGEAVGINFVGPRHRALLKAGLARLEDGDYFERGIELAVAAGARFVPLDVTDLFAVEIDFPDDLDRVDAHLRAGLTSSRVPS